MQHFTEREAKHPATTMVLKKYKVKQILATLPIFLKEVPTS